MNMCLEIDIALPTYLIYIELKLKDWTYSDDMDVSTYTAAGFASCSGHRSIALVATLRRRLISVIVGARMRAVAVLGVLPGIPAILAATDSLLK